MRVHTRDCAVVSNADGLDNRSGSIGNGKTELGAGGVQIWEEAGVEQCLADEHLVSELVPRVIAHLANRHGAPAGESTALLNNELLLQVAAALGQMETASLFELTEKLHRLSVTELRTSIEVCSVAVHLTPML